jgi:hypothetical protein
MILSSIKRIALGSVIGLVSHSMSWAQSSAVDATSAGSIGAVGVINATFLNDPAASGSYTYVYRANGSSGTTSSQSGTKPSGMTISNTVTGAGTSYTLQPLDNIYYIRRRVMSWNCTGATSWEEKVLAGPVVNPAPLVSSFTINSGGAQVTHVLKHSRYMVQGVVLDNATAAAPNLTDVNLRELSAANGATWSEGSAAQSSRWSGSGGGAAPGITVSRLVVVNTPGTWLYRLQATDTRLENALVVEKSLTVLDRLYYDVGDTHLGLSPAVAIAGGGVPVRQLGVSGRAAITLELRNAQGGLLTAGAAVRVALGAGTGLLYTAATGGTGQGALELVTAANGTVTVHWEVGTEMQINPRLYVQAGGTMESLALEIRRNDLDGDGLTNAIEYYAVGNPYTALRSSSPPVGFAVFGL